MRMVSFGPDCALKYHIEQYVHGGKHVQSDLFDWAVAGLSAVALVLEHLADEEPYFGVASWEHVGQTATAHHVFLHTPTGLRSLHDAPAAKFESIALAQGAVAARHETRRLRLRELLCGAERACCVHIADADNTDSPQPLPDRAAIARVFAALRLLGTAGHALVILIDGRCSAPDALGTEGVIITDLRGFLRAQASDHGAPPWMRVQYNWKQVLADMAATATKVLEPTTFAAGLEPDVVDESTLSG
mmetsp:Transcript_21254/g.57189  ORF Transcript_21254/g.57189 Transcript_21254/m.57189 type:complete len:246 (-) Transcript_21254:348-1085(-)